MRVTPLILLVAALPPIVAFSLVVPRSSSSCSSQKKLCPSLLFGEPMMGATTRTRLRMTTKPDKDEQKRKSGEDEEDEDMEKFSAFLQRMSQLPLVNGNVVVPPEDNTRTTDNNNNKQSSANKETPPSGRNPFLSPFFGLLNLEDVLGSSVTTNSKDALLPTSKMNSKSTKERPTAEVINSWGRFVTTLRQSIGDPFGNETATSGTVEPPSFFTSSFLSSASTATDDFVREASTIAESVLVAASTAVSPDAFTNVIQQARNVLKFQDDLVAAATKTARDRGLDGFEAAERARNTTDYVASLVAVADQVLRSGYVQKEGSYAAIAGDRDGQAMLLLGDSNDDSSSSSKPLFDKIASARAISYEEFGPAISTIAEMGWLSGGIYENQVERPHELEHSIVAEGISADVYWMITDSVENEADYVLDSNNDDAKDISVRTIIVRGFDASDERVDREELLNEICNLKSQPFFDDDDDNNIPGLVVHSGLYKLAKAVYQDIQRYIDWSAPAQKIIFTGHSVGGSISLLLTLMLARDRGVDFVRNKILRVFTFGSPPAFMLEKTVERKVPSQGCEILDLFGLPASLVYGQVQPWDPIPRLFSPIDGLYPLVDDIGEDGVTPYASGPPRSLRLVTRALVEAWEGWPQFRDKMRAAGPQGYQPVGLQHIILPEPVRYLTDRFVNVNVNVPPADELVRVSPAELYEALETIFPLDVFELSYVTSAIRGFLHHFYPAYDAPLVAYAQKVSRESMVQTKQEELVQSIDTPKVADEEEGSDGSNSWGSAEQWLKNVVPSE
ncbi:Lipase (class 3) [Seminavis robusta]|uniref:Lipase (Class 3) n=1 Tax=Seminavis robusta TaxID=568900 RepID=A0A9N8HA47_9STRA|nr:Lipase (class 3) [Seminavis robusta]|eukprot:Sro213_g088390.1 Lipase (class 3) (786) ;mRNA; f:29277-31731